MAMAFERSHTSNDFSAMSKMHFHNDSVSDDPDEGENDEDTIEFFVDPNAYLDPSNYHDKNNENSIWSLQDFALRDLLVYLVQKHRIDEVYDSKSKARSWEQLYEDFHHLTEKRVAISQLQIIRKWHNWKQYNKAHKKPHPFVVCGNFDPNLVLQKCAQLCEQAKIDPNISAILARGPVECVDPKTVHKVDSQPESITVEDLLLKRHTYPEIIKIIDRDFLPGKRASNQTTTWALKRLRHDIELMKLAYEEEMWRTKLENVKLLTLKLQRKEEAMHLKFERVQIELAIKKHCLRLGLSESVLQD